MGAVRIIFINIAGRLALALVVPSTLLISVPSVNAQTPEPTPSPPAANLVAPAELVVQADGARWRDDSTGEDGYRVVATLGSDARTFDLPADSTALALPEDFRAICETPGRSILSVRVFAFKGTQEGEAAIGESTMLCPPITTPTSLAPSALPSTGFGEGAGGDSNAEAWRVFAAIAAATGVLATLGLRERSCRHKVGD